MIVTFENNIFLFGEFDGIFKITHRDIFGYICDTRFIIHFFTKSLDTQTKLRTETSMHINAFNKLFSMNDRARTRKDISENMKPNPTSPLKTLLPSFW